jgi:hypothetical protein
MALVGGKSASLAISQAGFLQFCHAAVSARIEGEVFRELQLGAHLLHDLLHSGERIGLA